MTDWIAVVRGRLRDASDNPAREAEIVEELAQHLALRVAELIAEGDDPEAARRRVLAELPEWRRLADDIRGADRPRPAAPVPPPPRSSNPLATFAHDIRYACRLAVRSPGVSLPVVVLMALALGVGTAAFSGLKAIALDPLPYDDPERLVVTWTTPAGERISQPMSYPDYLDWRARSRSFAELGLQTLEWTNLGGGEYPERVRAVVCTASFLRALGVPPARGRIFTDEEERRRERVLMLGDGLWRRRFGSDPGVVGSQVELNGVPYTVIGVMPARWRSFRPWFTDSDGEFWIPLDPGVDRSNRDRHWLFGLGRLAPGVSAEAAERELVAVAAGLAREHPETNALDTAWVQPLADRVAGDVRRPLWFLFAATGLLVAVGTVNVAGLLLARASSRTMELGIRVSLGASPWRFVSASVAESLVLCGAGGLAGVIAAWWGSDALRRMIPATIQNAAGIGLDAGVLAFSVLSTLVCGVLAGLAPVAVLAGGSAGRVLQAGRRSVAGERRPSRLQAALVVAQVALVLALVHAAALMLQSHWNVMAVPVGFDTERVVVAGISLQGDEYADSAERQAAFWDRLVESIRSEPGVETVGATTKLPLNGGTNGPMLVDGERFDPTVERPTVERSYVTPGYFAAAGIPVTAGRALEAADFGEREYGVVVNEAFVRRFWPGQRALGRRIHPNTAARTWSATIVGVVGDVRQWGLERAPLPEVYFPFGATTRNTRHLVVRAGAAPGTIDRAIRRAVDTIDGRQAVSSVRTLGELVTGDSARRRFQTRLSVIFAVVGLAVVLVGVHGTLAWQVARRTREFGIRMALGAEARSIVGNVVAGGLRLAGIGTILGFALAMGVSRLVEGLVFGVSPRNPLLIAGVAVLMGAAGVVGAAAPARRAARIDPIESLRE